MSPPQQGHEDYYDSGQICRGGINLGRELGSKMFVCIAFKFLHVSTVGEMGSSKEIPKVSSPCINKLRTMVLLSGS